MNDYAINIQRGIEARGGAMNAEFRLTDERIAEIETLLFNYDGEPDEKFYVYLATELLAEVRRLRLWEKAALSGAGVTVRLNKREMDVLWELANDTDLSPERAMVQALRVYQLFRAGKLYVAADPESGCGGEEKP